MVCFLRSIGLMLHCTLHFLSYISVYNDNSLISCISPANVYTWHFIDSLSLRSACFFIIIIICPQAVGTEVHRDCNFKAHICRFSYLLGCISSLWFILSSQLPYSSSNLNRLVHKDFPPPQGLFPRLNFIRWSKNYSCYHRRPKLTSREKAND